MCIVSAIHDYGMNIPTDSWSKKAFKEWQKMMDAAKQFDKETKQPDCVDPAKEQLIRDVIESLKKQGKL